MPPKPVLNKGSKADRRSNIKGHIRVLKGIPVNSAASSSRVNQVRPRRSIWSN